MKKNNKKKLHEEDEVDVMEEMSQEELEQEIGSLLGMNQPPEMRMIGLYGEVNEKRASEIVFTLIALSRTKKVTHEGKKTIETVEPVEFLISTPGGSASDMFSIYDTMKMVQKTMDIETIGMGRVMSAGVLIMAAGTKGKRKIGRNCRVMIHSAIGGMMGSSHDIKNEFAELTLSESQYIKGLAKETKMTEKQIKEYLSQKQNIYLSAHQAVKLGIADIII